MPHFIHPALFAEKTRAKGLGIFCREKLPADLVVESSPVIVMEETARTHLDQTRLHDYIFEWQPDGQQLCCVALGYLSLYNHSYSSNCEYFMDYDACVMSIKTMRDIEAGEELSINYNGDWDDTKPVWFEATD